MVSVIVVSFSLKARGFLLEAGQARRVAGGNTDRDEIHGDVLGCAVRLLSQIVVPTGQAAV
jgi:hypothetical protein